MKKYSLFLFSSLISILSIAQIQSLSGEFALESGEDFKRPYKAISYMSNQYGAESVFYHNNEMVKVFFKDGVVYVHRFSLTDLSQVREIETKTLHKSLVFQSMEKLGEDVYIFFHKNANMIVYKIPLGSQVLKEPELVLDLQSTYISENSHLESPRWFLPFDVYTDTVNNEFIIVEEIGNENELNFEFIRFDHSFNVINRAKVSMQNYNYSNLDIRDCVFDDIGNIHFLISNYKLDSKKHKTNDGLQSDLIRISRDGTFDVIALEFPKDLTGANLFFRAGKIYISGFYGEPEIGYSLFCSDIEKFNNVKSCSYQIPETVLNMYVNGMKGNQNFFWLKMKDLILLDNGRILCVGVKEFDFATEGKSFVASYETFLAVIENNSMENIIKIPTKTLAIHAKYWKIKDDYIYLFTEDSDKNAELAKDESPRVALSYREKTSLVAFKVDLNSLNYSRIPIVDQKQMDCKCINLFNFGNLVDLGNSTFVFESCEYKDAKLLKVQIL